jgi:hypothetical protein
MIDRGIPHEQLAPSRPRESANKPSAAGSRDSKRDAAFGSGPTQGVTTDPQVCDNV